MALGADAAAASGGRDLDAEIWTRGAGWRMRGRITPPKDAAVTDAASALLLDGKAIAAAVRADLAQRVAARVEAGGRVPKLAAILVGDNPASETYVAAKARAAASVGVASETLRRPADLSQDALLALIADLNARADVDGVLLQLPLPGGLDAQAALETIAPRKDVDGLTYASAGRVFLGAAPALRRADDPWRGHVPCTPQGCMIVIGLAVARLAGNPGSWAELLTRAFADGGADLSGRRALVIGRSSLVGMPLAALLTHANATVTLAHSRTADLAARCREADILVAAVGRPGLVRGDWIKPGAIVIDVGINRAPAPEREATHGPGATKLIGDVAFEEARSVAGALTPVPGGVGPMTVACLLKNTIEAADASA